MPVQPWPGRIAGLPVPAGGVPPRAWPDDGIRVLTIYFHTRIDVGIKQETFRFC